MQSILAFITKKLSTLLQLIVGIIIIDTLIFMLFFHIFLSVEYSMTPTKELQRISNELHDTPSGYSLSASMKQELEEQKLWIIVLNDLGDVTFSANTPSHLPSHYSLGDVAVFSKGYIHDYPIFTQKHKTALLIVGYPKTSYFKILSNYFPIAVLKKIPLLIFLLFVSNCCILYLYFASTRKHIFATIAPITDGIQKLSNGEEVHIDVTGELSEISKSIHTASHLLKKQNQARANWISGISHDIRTPLSTIIGYSNSISNSTFVDETIKNQAKIIEKQSLFINDLVQDLNIVSQLEYSVDQFERKPVFLCKLIREIVSEYMNNHLNSTYTFTFTRNPSAEHVYIEGDKRLLYRAIINLISNSIKHNPQGCHICIDIQISKEMILLSINDNGIGVSSEKLEKLHTTPHYFNSTDERLDLRHGLGLLIVDEIMQLHNGRFTFESEVDKGFKSQLTFTYFTKSNS